MRLKLFSLFLTLSVFVLVGAGCASQPGQETLDPQGIILFEGEGCPHCAIVEEFLAQNKVKDKVEFTTLEVYKNKNNAALMAKKAQLCNIPTTGMGVPFLWDGSKCLVGDVDINNFFQEKIK
ncbi:MAG: hypothetical protein NTU97_04970 [Candidatus Magasanikbacteria bacterium]|nr:hypothetical protein [Candidatus Magasanikbacteria bacterium]